MKKVFIILLSAFSFATSNMYAQQTSQSNFFTSSRAFWNPAYTGFEPSISADLYVRQQWLGFGSSAPRTIMADYQHSFVDYNMAAGGNLLFDQTGPVSKRGVNGQYAYQLQDLGANNGILSMGINAGVQQYVFDPSKETVISESDPLLSNANKTGIFPSVGAGIFYQAGNRKWRDDAYLFAGFSYLQAYQTNVLVGQLNQKRVAHAIFDIGAKIYNYDYLIEPMISVNYSNPDLISTLLGVNFTMKDVFWAGVGYVSVGDVSLQGGYIIDEINGRDTRLKLGVASSFGLADRFKSFGPSAELFIRYEFDLD